ncbi:hypothetical protein H1R20_g11039, partial [Candolleomyces eurysporus]
MAGRMRRNAVSASGGSSSSVSAPTRVTITRGGKTIEHWREVVKNRWNSEIQFLNLESLIDDEAVKKYNLSPPGVGGGSARDAAVILKLASELKPPVKTLSLANNKLAGEHLQYISKYLPKLANLSLSNNNLRHWKDLDFISGRKEKLVHLRELLLIGNPVRELEYKNNRAERYKQELTRRFPSLEVLDSEPVAQISFGVQQAAAAIPVKKPDATTFPYPMSGSFITGVDGGLVSNFLVRFFALFDNQRDQLVDAYDPQASFSFSVNTTIPIRARIQGLHTSKELPNQRKLEWSPWLGGGEGGSRNLNRMHGGLERAVKSLHIGGEAAVKAVQSLPGTRHDIGGPPEKFCLEAFPVPLGANAGMGLLVALHGQFTELPADGVRSFDRTFLLAPAPDGSRAKLNGWDVVILSDQLTIRAYSSPEAWKSGDLLVQAQAKSTPTSNGSTSQNQLPQTVISSLPPEQQSALATIPEPQRNLVIELMSRTSLNVKFAVDCLQNNEWNMDKAYANFEQVKATLGREAYL